MIDVNDLRKGVTFEFDGSLYKVLEYSHNKPGRGNATIRIKARDLRSGTTLEKTFQSGDRVQDVRLDYRPVQYTYNDSNFYYFMDLETYEELAVSNKVVEEFVGFLKENIEVKLTYLREEPIDLELPTSVDLKVIEAEAAVRGDTATSVTKKVKVETGMEVGVPYFVVTGDVVRVDTRTGEYLTRVSQ
jgi:elongation factor P